MTPVVASPAERAARLEHHLKGARHENRRLAGEVAGLRAEVAQLRSMLTPSIAESGPFYVWIAGYGDRRFVGYKHHGKIYVPGLRVIEEADILRTEPAPNMA